MGYSAEVIRRARQRLEQAKADRESENRQNLQTAYQQVPRIREIDRQLRQTMAVAVQTAFSKGIDVRQAMNNVKEQNLNLQRERAALAALHFEEGFLDETPICDRCGGSGYVGSTMCESLMELCRQEQKKELSLLSCGKETFNQFRLDYYSDQYDPRFGSSPRIIMSQNLRNCRDFANTFSPASGNLLFVGNPGLGKTLLSACIARTVADRGFSVIYESASRLFSTLEQARFNPNDDNRRQAEKLYQCDLLIIDDLGTEMPGQFITAALYTLVNERILASRPMIISTNLNIDEITRRYSPQIASRLHGDFIGLTFVGDDIRVMKNRRM
jgi:DNA replication protein DnaC